MLEGCGRPGEKGVGSEFDQSTVYMHVKFLIKKSKN